MQQSNIERLPSLDKLPHSYYYKQGTRREIVTAGKNKPCADCGNEYPLCCMDYDHVQGDKLFNISQSNGKGITIEMIYAEIGKCDVVCANCHRIRTRNRTL